MVSILFGIVTGRPSKTVAVTIYPFIIVKSSVQLEPWILIHENIHLRQQRDLLIIGVILLGLVEVLYALIFKKLSLFETYRWQSAEQEAYLNYHNIEYLKTRKVLSQFRYVKNKKQFEMNSGGELTVL